MIKKAKTPSRGVKVQRNDVMRGEKHWSDDLRMILFYVFNQSGDDVIQLETEPVVKN